MHNTLSLRMFIGQNVDPAISILPSPTRTPEMCIDYEEAQLHTTLNELNKWPQELRPYSTLKRFWLRFRGFEARKPPLAPPSPCQDSTPIYEIGGV